MKMLKFWLEVTRMDRIRQEQFGHVLRRHSQYIGQMDVEVGAGVLEDIGKDDGREKERQEIC